MTRQDDANIYIKRFLDQVKGASEEDVAFALSNLIVSVGMIVAMIGLPPVPRLFPEEKGSNADVFMKYVRRAVAERVAEVSRPEATQESDAAVALFDEMVKSFVRKTTSDS